MVAAYKPLERLCVPAFSVSLNFSCSAISQVTDLLGQQYRINWKQHVGHGRRDTKITKRKFGKTSKLMKIFCFVIFAAHLSLGVERTMMMIMTIRR
jgi:hypothetical protein